MSRSLRSFASRPLAVVGLLVLFLIGAVALAAPYLYPGDPLDTVAQPLLWPAQVAQYPLGTDALGRDVAAQIAHGARASLTTGFAAGLIGVLLGTVLGAVAGYFGGWADDVLSRVTELFQVTPSFLLMIVIVALGSPSAQVISLAIGLTSWPTVARLVRAEFRTLKERDFVLAARTLGFGNARIILREILPNALAPVIVTATVLVATAILMGASLAFLGLADPNTVSWGSMIGDGRGLLRTAWYLTALPGFSLTLTVVALNLVGDGLTEALNPRLRELVA
jgi:peptide/nickel transport system permease protein